MDMISIISSLFVLYGHVWRTLAITGEKISNQHLCLLFGISTMISNFKDFSFCLRNLQDGINN